MLSSRFRVLCADAGLSMEDTAKILHVTPRTVRNWFSGKSTIPFAAYKLLRVMRLFELPCVGWDGWHMHSGKLWSPEGHGFTSSDSSWWGLLVRKARLFHQLYDRDRELNMLMLRAGRQSPSGQGDALAQPWPVAADDPTGNAGRAAQPPGLDLSNKHFRTEKQKSEERRGLQPGLENPQFVTNTLADANNGLGRAKS